MTGFWKRNASVDNLFFCYSSRAIPCKQKCTVPTHLVIPTI
jgi:hypothetical protein